ncbi:MAG: helix-turn-helix domain-containing protein [Acidobacteriota bacterium]|nr:helix-turn-helix domain-containing protein [Acidobacteriota bacterium]
MRLLTAQEVSDLLQVPVARVYELVRLNLLPVVKLGERQMRFNEEQLREWIERGGCTPIVSNTGAGSDKCNN